MSGPQWGHREDCAGGGVGKQPLLLGVEGARAIVTKATSAHAL